MREISWNAFSMRFNFLKGDFSPLLQTLLHTYLYPVPLSIRDGTFLLMLRSSRTMPFSPSWLSKPCRVLSFTKAWHHRINSSRFQKLRKNLLQRIQLSTCSILPFHVSRVCVFLCFHKIDEQYVLSVPHHKNIISRLEPMTCHRKRGWSGT